MSAAAIGQLRIRISPQQPLNLRSIPSPLAAAVPDAQLESSQSHLNSRSGKDGDEMQSLRRLRESICFVLR